ncbi:MAG TPA: YtxH domain-containing protein [Balneolales bacterium]|nr:YtxH domain-containing protein [Balneolales bacterium]
MAASKSNITLLLVGASSFLSGVALGFLMTPKSGKDNLKWITGQADDIVDWLDQRSRSVLDKTERRLNNLKSNMHKSIPDLYLATENLTMDESELID